MGKHSHKTFGALSPSQYEALRREAQNDDGALEVLEDHILESGKAETREEALAIIFPLLAEDVLDVVTGSYAEQALRGWPPAKAGSILDQLSSAIDQIERNVEQGGEYALESRDFDQVEDGVFSLADALDEVENVSDATAVELRTAGNELPWSAQGVVYILSPLLEEAHGLLEERFSIDSFSQDTKEEMREDCYEFVRRNYDQIEKIRLKNHRPEHVGSEFWLARNGFEVSSGFVDLRRPAQKLGARDIYQDKHGELRLYGLGVDTADSIRRENDFRKHRRED